MSIVDPKESDGLRTFKVFVPDWYGSCPLHRSARTPQEAAEDLIESCHDGGEDLFNKPVQVQVVDADGEVIHFAVSMQAGYHAEELA